MHFDSVIDLLQLVIGNMLQTRKTKVVMVEMDVHYEILLTEEEINAGVELEEKIIKDLVERHLARKRN